MSRTFAILGAVLAFVGVGAGAFGAHALRAHFDRFPDLRAIYQTATQYQMYHALGLLAVAWAMSKWPGGWFGWAGYLFLAGIVIFSGSLYLLSITGVRWLGAITPLGGVAFLAGWACLAIGVWRAV